LPDDLKWRSIAEAIAADITSGRQPVGSKLPRHNDPAEMVRHDADPNTIREARSYLRDVGVLRTSPRGTFVAQLPPAPLPERRRVSPLERRLTVLIDDLRERVERLERGE
jgi:DNA-binding GntR family transcriptional regulator